MVYDVLRDDLLGPREVLDTRADVRGDGLAKVGGRLRGTRGRCRHGRADCLLHRQACDSTPARGVPSERAQPVPGSCSWCCFRSARICATTYRISTFTTIPIPTNVISRAIVCLVAASAARSIVAAQER